MRYSLNRPMVLEEVVTTPDGAGGFTTSWTELGTLWAELRAGSGTQQRGTIAPEGRMLFRVYMRAAPQGSPQRPRPDQRLREGDRFFGGVQRRVLAMNLHHLGHSALFHIVTGNSH